MVAKVKIMQMQITLSDGYNMKRSIINLKQKFYKRKNMKFKKTSILAVSCLVFFSCQQQYSGEMYSCDPDVDTWVKRNLKEIRVMTRSEWNELDEDYKRGAYEAFTPEQRQKLWIQKIENVLALDWEDGEKAHLENLLNYVKNNCLLFDYESENRIEILEKFEVYFYKWNEYATDNLGWTKDQIGAITSTANNLIDKAGKVEIKSNSNLKLKTSSESSCNCSTTSDWCSHWIGQQECSNSWSCDESGHCGTLFQYTCDGLCSLAI